MLIVVASVFDPLKCIFTTPDFVYIHFFCLKLSLFGINVCSVCFIELVNLFCVVSILNLPSTFKEQSEHSRLHRDVRAVLFIC